ncbi:hypothetical protein J3A83DRAFT_1076389 [Scleroderma citrinum]
MKLDKGKQASGKSHQKARHHPYRDNARQTTSRDSLPGVQKIKSSLRQARRLLTKENLAANVRVETDRKIKALEADLAKAQNARQERTMAIRYHKVKFFERQKVVRKIKQMKRNLAVAENNQLESTLFDLRVDLNYILHYPKTKKYISLFPPEVRNSNVLPAAIKIKDDDERSKIRALICSKMQCGELSMEPELDLERPEWERSGVQRKGIDVTDGGEGSSKQDPKPIEDASEDEFFGDDDDISESSG